MSQADTGAVNGTEQWWAQSFFVPTNSVMPLPVSPLAPALPSALHSFSEDGLGPGARTAPAPTPSPNTGAGAGRAVRGSASLVYRWR
jgi:hypothetical protein